MRKLNSLLLASALLVSTAASPVLAQDWHGHDGGRGHDDFHGGGHDDWHWHGDIHAFNEYDYDHWRGGHWWQGYHDGRNGWWWLAGGGWYFYPAPVYPYPDPYTPPTVVVETTPSAGPAYYYCANPAGYYPYVPQCPGPWQKVITTTAAPPAQVIVQQPATVAVMDPHAVDAQKLDAFAAEFHSINPADPHARKRLKTLATRVETFRKGLYHRGYNALDIMENAENLQHQISAERTALAHHTVIVQTPAPATTPPPDYVLAPAATSPSQQPMAPTTAPTNALPPSLLPPR